MKKDMEIHEALDTAKNALRTTYVKVSIGKPLFSVEASSFPALDTVVGETLLRCRIYVLSLHSALHATDTNHVIWKLVAAADTWWAALQMVWSMTGLLNSVAACRERDAREGVSFPLEREIKT